MPLGSDNLRLFFTGPYLVSLPLCSVSGVDCPSVDPRQLLLPASLLSCDQLLTLWSLPLSGSRRQLSFSGPLTTSGYGEISCPRILCLVSRQKQTRLLWRPAPIVLHTSLSYPCHLFSINYITI